MTELTVEKVKALLDACPEQLSFADMSGSIEGLYDIGGEVDNPESSPRFDRIAMPADSEDGSDPRWKLLEHTPDLARLVLSLDAQLQREREGRELAESNYDASLDNCERMIAEAYRLREVLQAKAAKWSKDADTASSDGEAPWQLVRASIELLAALQPAPQTQGEKE